MIYRGEPLTFERILPREANFLGHCAFLWTLRTSPRGMDCSRCQNPIPWKDHVSWVRTFLDKQGCALFFAVYPKGWWVGYGRLAFFANDICELSYMVRQEAEGQGVGTWIVKELCREAIETFGYHHAVANVQSTNFPSRRLLERQGFHGLGRDQDGFLAYTKRLSL